MKDIWNPEVYTCRVDMGKASTRIRGYQLKPIEDREDSIRGPWMDMVTRVYITDEFVLQETRELVTQENRRLVVLSVRRQDAKEIFETWSLFRQLLSDIGYADVWAYEAYPPTDLISNVANCRWFWIFPDASASDLLGAGLHRAGMVGDYATLPTKPKGRGSRQA